MNANINSAAATTNTRRRRALPVILVDTREQRPLQFSAAVETKRTTLGAGDYTIEGCDAARVERKTLDDFAHCSVHAWSRFKAQLDNLVGFRHSVVVVECSLGELLKNDTATLNLRRASLDEIINLEEADSLITKFCDDNPTLRDPHLPTVASLLGRAIAIEVKYGIPVHWCGDPFLTARWVEAYLVRCLKKEEET